MHDYFNKKALSDFHQGCQWLNTCNTIGMLIDTVHPKCFYALALATTFYNKKSHKWKLQSLPVCEFHYFLQSLLRDHNGRYCTQYHKHIDSVQNVCIFTTYYLPIHSFKLTSMVETCQQQATVKYTECPEVEMSHTQTQDTKHSHTCHRVLWGRNCYSWHAIKLANSSTHYKCSEWTVWSL